MLNKLKCMFGFHEWMYRDQDGPHHGRVLKERMCDNCKKQQKMTIITSLTPESCIDMESKYPAWINTTPDKPRDRPTPKPRSKIHQHLDMSSGGYFIDSSIDANLFQKGMESNND